MRKLIREIPPTWLKIQSWSNVHNGTFYLALFLLMMKYN